jgi:hypothetical protein
MADRPFYCPDACHYLCHDLALRPYLPRWNPYVWQEAEPAGNSEVDQVRMSFLCFGRSKELQWQHSLPALTLVSAAL